MATQTTDALEALLYIYNSNGANFYETARWNFPDAIGSSRFNPVGIGNAVTLEYSFLSSSNKAGFEVFDAEMITATNRVLASIEGIANIQFENVSPQKGQMTFGMASMNDAYSAYAYAPNYSLGWDGENIITSATESQLAGNVWVNADPTTPWNVADWQGGNFGYYVLLHEVGHALGLKHPFEGDGAGGGFVLDPTMDNEAHTVMSYDFAPRNLLIVNGGDDYAFLSASTMMMMDIEALQHLYGANMSTRSGNTVYDFDTNEELLETIWDGGGVDTLDCSNQVLTCRINLGDGEFSSIGLRRTDAEMKLGFDLPSTFIIHPDDRDSLYNGANNLGIAKGAIIENATGGSGNDVIMGNDVANRLTGGSGNDKLTGGSGNDKLAGGSGLDRMAGGTGRDLFDFNRLNDSTEARTDVITGFVSGSDRIDLSTLDAKATVTGNQDFTFIGGNDFSAAGQVRFEAGVLYGSTDADADAEVVIALAGVDALIAADLIL